MSLDSPSSRSSSLLLSGALGVIIALLMAAPTLRTTHGAGGAQKPRNAARFSSRRQMRAKRAMPQLPSGANPQLKSKHSVTPT